MKKQKQIEFDIRTYNNGVLHFVRHSALKWWNKLDERQKNTEIRQTFGDGEPWEDNVTITHGDIETMYKRHYA